MAKIRLVNDEDSNNNKNLLFVMMGTISLDMSQLALHRSCRIAIVGCRIQLDFSGLLFLLAHVCVDKPMSNNAEGMSITLWYR